MSTFSRIVLVAAALVLSAVARAQHAGHQSKEPSAPGPSAPAMEAARDGPYRSSFSGYRAFGTDVPLKDWKKANDEVREVGGHVGLLKGEPTQLRGHGAHGAKQHTPPARQK